MSSPCCFTLPLEIDTNNYINSEEETLLTVDSDGKQVKFVKFQGQVERHDAVKRKTVCSRIWFFMKIVKWHVLAYCVITSSFFAIFHFCLNKKDKKEVLQALTFLDDWKQLVFFFGIYLSYAVKKVGDVSAVSNQSNLASQKTFFAHFLCSLSLQLIKSPTWSHSPFINR
jgi:hypothetical protein